MLKLIQIIVLLACLAILALATVGCTVSLQGKPLFGLDPNARVQWNHPETIQTNEVFVPHL